MLVNLEANLCSTLRRKPSSLSETVIVDEIYKGCNLELASKSFKVKLIPCPSPHFDVIVGMDILPLLRASIQYFGVLQWLLLARRR
jgi:hypothetical protein